MDDSDLTKVAAVIQNQVLDSRNHYVSLEEQAIISARAPPKKHHKQSPHNLTAAAEFPLNRRQFLVKK